MHLYLYLLLLSHLHVMFGFLPSLMFMYCIWYWGSPFTMLSLDSVNAQWMSQYRWGGCCIHFTSFSDSNVACWILKLYIERTANEIPRQSSETIHWPAATRGHKKNVAIHQKRPMVVGLAPKCEWISMFSGYSNMSMVEAPPLPRPSFPRWLPRPYLRTRRCG